MESKHDIAFRDARLFQTLSDSQIGGVGLKPDYPIDDLRQTTGGVNAPRPVLIFPQNQVIIRPELGVTS